MSSASPAARPPVAELERVTRTYRMGTNEVRALDEFSFSFGRGEYWAVMGSSGSGKSTLLNLLGCLDRPSSGSYRIDGVDVSTLDDDELSEIRSQKLGFVFQSYNLIAQLNVLENILVPLFYQDEPPSGAEERARALAERSYNYVRAQQRLLRPDEEPSIDQLVRDYMDAAPPTSDPATPADPSQPGAPQIIEPRMRESSERIRLPGPKDKKERK